MKDWDNYSDNEAMSLSVGIIASMEFFYVFVEGFLCSREQERRQASPLGYLPSFWIMNECVIWDCFLGALLQISLLDPIF